MAGLSFPLRSLQSSVIWQGPVVATLFCKIKKNNRLNEERRRHSEYIYAEKGDEGRAVFHAETDKVQVVWIDRVDLVVGKLLHDVKRPFIETNNNTNFTAQFKRFGQNKILIGKNNLCKNKCYSRKAKLVNWALDVLGSFRNIWEIR